MSAREGFGDARNDRFESSINQNAKKEKGESLCGVATK